VSAVLVLSRSVAIIVLLALFLWIGNRQQQCLKQGPTSIIRLELAPTVEKADAFLGAWRRHRFSNSTECPGDWQAKLLTVQALDTWLILIYGPLFALLCWLAADHFRAVVGGAWALWPCSGGVATGRWCFGFYGEFRHQQDDFAGCRVRAVAVGVGECFFDQVVVDCGVLFVWGVCRGSLGWCLGGPEGRPGSAGLVKSARERLSRGRKR
jgi:hypothetical protein